VGGNQTWVAPWVSSTDLPNLPKGLKILDFYRIGYGWEKNYKCISFKSKKNKIKTESKKQNQQTKTNTKMTVTSSNINLTLTFNAMVERHGLPAIVGMVKLSFDERQKTLQKEEEAFGSLFGSSPSGSPSKKRKREDSEFSDEQAAAYRLRKGKCVKDKLNTKQLSKLVAIHGVKYRDMTGWTRDDKVAFIEDKILPTGGAKDEDSEDSDPDAGGSDFADQIDAMQEDMDSDSEDEDSEDEDSEVEDIEVEDSEDEEVDEEEEEGEMEKMEKKLAELRKKKEEKKEKKEKEMKENMEKREKKMAEKRKEKKGMKIKKEKK
jgi:hypothetical protein